MQSAKLDAFEICGPTLRATPAGLLTLKQLWVALWTGEGKTNEEIAIILGISPRTVKAHVLACCDRLGANGKTHMVARAFVSGVLHSAALIVLVMIFGGGGSGDIEKQRNARRVAARRGRDEYLEPLSPLSAGPTPNLEFV